MISKICELVKIDSRKFNREKEDEMMNKILKSTKSAKRVKRNLALEIISTYWKMWKNELKFSS